MGTMPNQEAPRHSHFGPAFTAATSVRARLLGVAAILNGLRRSFTKSRKKQG